MLHPSYTDLMKVVNKDIEEGESKIVNSRYSIVLATSKRARQIIDGDIPLVLSKGEEKPLSIAIRELNDEQLKILAENASLYDFHDDFDFELDSNILLHDLDENGIVPSNTLDDAIDTQADAKENITLLDDVELDEPLFIEEE